MPSPTRQQVSSAIAQLMPRIIQGIRLDVFLRRGVTQTQFLVLVAIHGYRQCPMGTLAQSLHVRMPTATGVVARLVRAGLLRRIPRHEDRRHVIVELTPKGQRFIAQFQQVIRTRWKDVLRSLNQEELEAFYRVITKLTQQLHPGRSS